MKTQHKLVLCLALISTCATPLHSQNCNNQVCYQEDYPYPYEEEGGEAYYASTRSAHWSAYVPIGILIGAAIWLGFADKNSSSSSFGHYSVLGDSSNNSSMFGSSSSSSNSSGSCGSSSSSVFSSSSSSSSCSSSITQSTTRSITSISH